MKNPHISQKFHKQNVPGKFNKPFILTAHISSPNELTFTVVILSLLNTFWVCKSNCVKIKFMGCITSKCRTVRFVILNLQASFHTSHVVILMTYTSPNFTPLSLTIHQLLSKNRQLMKHSAKPPFCHVIFYEITFRITYFPKIPYHT